MCIDIDIDIHELVCFVCCNIVGTRTHNGQTGLTFK